MPQSNEGILLLVGALFLLLGLLGGGFEVSAIKIPPVGKYTRAFAFVIGASVFGLGLLRLALPVTQPTVVTVIPTALQATAVPTTAPTAIPPSPLPPSPLPPTISIAPSATPTVSLPTLPPPTEGPEGTVLPQSASIQDVHVDYDVTRFEKKGMVIHVKFSITGMKNQEGRATAYFARQDGEALKDKNGQYNTTDGQVSTGESFTPGYEVTQYDNLELFIPYDELELGPGAYKLKFHVEVWERAHPEKSALAISPDIDFDFSK